MKEEKEYIDCNRCGKQIELATHLDNHEVYENGILCLQCVRIRIFDDDNPIMYPVKQNDA